MRCGSVEFCLPARCQHHISVGGRTSLVCEVRRGGEGKCRLLYGKRDIDNRRKKKDTSSSDFRGVEKIKNWVEEKGGWAFRGVEWSHLYIVLFGGVCGGTELTENGLPVCLLRRGRDGRDGAALSAGAVRDYPEVRRKMEIASCLQCEEKSFEK